MQILHRLGRFLNCLSWKKICSPAVNTKSWPQSTHFSILSWNSMGSPFSPNSTTLLLHVWRVSLTPRCQPCAGWQDRALTECVKIAGNTEVPGSDALVRYDKQAGMLEMLLPNAPYCEAFCKTISGRLSVRWPGGTVPIFSGSSNRTRQRRQLCRFLRAFGSGIVNILGRFEYERSHRPHGSSRHTGRACSQTGGVR